MFCLRTPVSLVKCSIGSNGEITFSPVPGWNSWKRLYYIIDKVRKTYFWGSSLTSQKSQQKFGLINNSTDSFTQTEPLNLSIDISELHKVRPSQNFVTLRLCKVRSGSWIVVSQLPIRGLSQSYKQHTDLQYFIPFLCACFLSFLEEGQHFWRIFLTLISSSIISQGFELQTGLVPKNGFISWIMENSL